MAEIHVAETSLSVALARRDFTSRRHGYDREEVDRFLDHLAVDAARLVEEATATAQRCDAAEASVNGLRERVADLQTALRTATDEIDALRDAIEHERSDRGAAEARAEAMAEELDRLREDADRDPFQAFGEQVAGVLRSAYAASDEIRMDTEKAARSIRESATSEAAALRAETEELVQSLLDDADAKARAANEEAERIVTEARVRVEELGHLEIDLRDGLEAAAGWILRAAREPLSSLPPAPSLDQSDR